jgi:3-oxoacyl-[acyl-carrier protein] reductase
MAAAQDRFGRLDGALISVGGSPPGTVATTTDDGVVKTLADELGPAGIRTNAILPVRIATDRVRELDALTGDPDEVRPRLSERIPLRRYGEPEEFGRTAAFLLSPAASYITGAMIPVDGGAIRSI